MKTIQRFAVSGVILIVASSGAISQHTQTSPSSNLQGAWKLGSVGGKDPATINIKSWQIEFREQGKWIYYGAMTGKYEGMQLSGSGTWLLERNQFDYTAGANKGKTAIQIDGDSLTFSPDPVIRLQGKEPIETRYVRLVSP
jgi:hypothetical protein